MIIGSTLKALENVAAVIYDLLKEARPRSFYRDRRERTRMRQDVSIFTVKSSPSFVSRHVCARRSQKVSKKLVLLLHQRRTSDTPSYVIRICADNARIQVARLYSKLNILIFFFRNSLCALCYGRAFMEIDIARENSLCKVLILPWLPILMTNSLRGIHNFFSIFSSIKIPSPPFFSFRSLEVTRCYVET